jgi:Ca-activated chloride channel family protein
MLSRITFAHPWFLLLLLLLPLLAWWRNRRGQQTAFLYSSVQLVKPVADMTQWNSGKILRAMRWIALGLFIIGLARPQKIESETAIKASGVDIVVALDLSGTMAGEDPGFVLKGQQVNRLIIAKNVLEQFISKRPSDRIGLVAFAGRAYIAAPLTLDHDFLLQNLSRLDLGTISEDGTAIGSALSTSINRLRDLKSKSKIVILMTDGQNNAGNLPPLTAADAAQALGVKVYTIGVGTRGEAMMPVGRDMFGRVVKRPVPVDIDEEVLQAIAHKTGGKYYRADTADTLRKIYDDIDRLEKTEVETKKYVNVDERFAWVVVPGFFLLMLEIILSNTVWRRLP